MMKETVKEVMRKILAFLILALVLLTTPVMAADQPATDQTVTNQGAANQPAEAPSGVESWLSMVSGTQEKQPHWMTPLATTTPRLEQEYRYDQYWQYASGTTLKTYYGAGKGLELIPSQNTEVIIGVPNYYTKGTPTTTSSGWQDETLLLKYRLLSANEESGNYIVTAFMGMSLPTGSMNLTAREVTFTPTIAAGKGWGTRDQGVHIETTLGYSIPTRDTSPINVASWASNTTLQVHFLKYLWPEVEANYTHFQQGDDAGKDQLLMTYGVVLGRFSIQGRENLNIGVGYQAVVSSFTTYNRAWVTTLRLTF